jgi:hypothetical protein
MVCVSAQVPDYSLVSSLHVNDKHMRVRVAPDGGGNTDTEYNIYLDEPTSARLLSPHIISIIRDGEKSRMKAGGLFYESDCHYRARVVSHANASAAVSLCETIVRKLNLIFIMNQQTHSVAR